ncbi:MAG TPA: pyridoxamine 5'-phosphate oxidase family protein [Bryobacteraceae bacterium]|nr:pyridoxamine 5'-phosphate oxidase family protein [Bryobacteraceae bacterium]
MASGHPVSIDDELKAFLQGPVSVLVGTRDSRLVPEITRAWGPRVSEDRQRVSLCVPLATSRKTLDNLEANGEIAVTLSLPTNYRTFQLKGRHATAAEPDSTDLAAVARHRDAFAAVNEPLGQSRQRVEAFWRAEMETSAVLVKIQFVPERLFDQTPGPGAGRSL